MTRAGVWRALTPTERVHADREAYVGYVVRTAGRLDLNALRAAYAAVCHAYPQLSARLVADGDGFVFVESDARPEVRIGDGDVERPLTGVDLNQYRALSALHVVRDGDEASVCLLTHHSIADAHHSITVLAALWSCYTEAVHGRPVELPRHPYPRPLEDLLAERGIRRTPPAAPRTAGRPGVVDKPVPDRIAAPRHVVQHRLTAAQTMALAELGHREHVTVNGLLAGTLLLVEAEIRDLPLTELVYRFTVDLRRHLTPQVGPTEGTNVLGGAGFTVTDDVEPDAVAIGRAIGQRLRAGLADGSVQRSLLDLLSQSTPDTRPWAPSTAPAVVSMMNWGRVPPLHAPDGVRLTNFHSTSRISETSAIGGYVVSTFDGRIGIDLAWPEGDPDLSRRLDCLRHRVSRMAPRW